MGDPDKEKWNTETMREHRTSWSLAADTQLLYYMQQFSQNLLSETHATLKAVESLESQVETTSVEVSNLGSRFWTLSDTQFVENRVYDDDDVTSPTLPKTQPEEDKDAVVINRLKEALQNGFKVLDTRFEMIQVPVSDSDDEDTTSHSGVVLKPINRYRDRPLPHLIGSAEFRSDDTLGLRDPPSDEETDDFMSASDKAYDESEDSDVESDQTKSQDLPEQNEDSILQSHAQTSPKLMQTPITPSSVLIGDMFGESGKDLLATQPANKKPLFTSWQQPSDLWTPDEDAQKTFDDNPASHRPPSAASSVSSAQSSNISEPVKKNSEDFGKSGSGRMPVFVQEDQNDLFASKSEASKIPQNKKPIPTGGIKIFQGDFNPFSNLHQNKDALSDESEHSQQSRWEDDDENDLFGKSNNISSTSLPKSSQPSSKLAKKKDDLFDDESDGDLFSNSELTKSNKSKPSDIISSSGSTSSLATNKTQSSISKSDLPQRKSILFGDTTGESEEEDDLFSSKSTFFNPKSNDLFSDDIFKSDSKDIFSNLEIPKETNLVKGNSVSKEVDSLFSNNISSHQPITSERSFKDKKEKVFFSNDEYIFGDKGFLEDDSLLGPSNVSKQAVNQPRSKDQNASQSHTKNLVKSKLWETDDDDLFSNTSVTSVKHIKDAELPFNSKNNSDALKGDLFGSLKLPESHMKGKPEISKLKKGIETRSLFESDSDDDLFSSPQGSLSSRKSVQMANAAIGHKDIQKPSTVETEDVLFKRTKTDFGSIFSDDLNESSNLITSSDILANKKHDIFEDDVGMSSGLISDIKTPDLFKSESNNSTETKQSLGVSDANRKDNEGIFIEAINPELISSTVKQASVSNTKDFFPENTDLFEDITVKNVEVVNVKKTEPPRTLDIKPILGNLSSNKIHSADKKVSESVQKPPVSTKPSKKSSEIKEDSSDATNDDISVSSHVSRTIPGKLKSSQLININPIALLPGAKPQLKAERSPDSEEQTHVTDGSQILTSTAVETPLPLHSSKSDSSLSTQEECLPPPVSGLLQSVNKERPKIQGKRRPSSRRARQEAIRASSIEVEEERTTLPPPSSNLMSPSTDEEDLFSVPPLDVITDGAKTISPKTDIFGTPTVLSPVVKEFPSSFVSTPFISSQPPPLDDEEDASAQDDDMFGYEDNLFVTSVKEKKSSLNNVSREAVSVDAARDLFGFIDEDRLFSDVREAPPPLILDEDDDENDSKFFMSNSKNKSITSKMFEDSNKIASNSDRNTQKLFDNEDSLSSNYKTDSLFNTGTKKPSENPKSVSVVSDSSMSLFLSETESTSNDPLFAPAISTNEVDNSSSIGHIVRDDDSVILESKNHSDQVKTENPPNESIASLNKGKLDSAKDLFTDDDDDDLFGSHITEHSTFGSSGSSANTKLNESSIISAKNVDSKVSTKIESQNVTTSHSLEGKINKKNTLFDDDETESSSLFLPGTAKLGKSESSLRPSLFGDEDDDDDGSIFGPSTVPGKISGTTNPPQGPSYVASQTSSGSTQAKTRSRTSGSLKPVKLETKETFSDPLLSNKD